jgi:hypothetical protein
LALNGTHRLLVYVDDSNIESENINNDNEKHRRSVRGVWRMTQK